MLEKKKKKVNCKKKNQTGLHPLLYEVIGLMMIGIAVIIMFEFGEAGRGLSSLSMLLLGNWHGAIPLLLLFKHLFS